MPKYGRMDWDSSGWQTKGPKLDPGEPVFLIRGQDVLGAETVEAYADRLEDAGGDVRTIESAREQAARMRQWRRAGGGQMPTV